MIVMIALLNDGAILSIAYDNVLYRNKPEAWNMRLVLSISTVLGVIGVVSAFLLFYLGERVFHMDRLTVQTLMYLKLSVAGHLTIFLTRTRGPFWSIRPAKILLIAVVGTQAIATLIAVYGVFMAPLGWKWAGLVWAYALAWALINDRVKLLAYRIFDPINMAIPQTAVAGDDTQQIATRAYEIYQERILGESQQDQDWLEAERETHLEETAKKKPAA
jgi:H+-transporting ATPase